MTDLREKVRVAKAASNASKTIVAAGYRVVSRRYMTVARIPHKDWEKRLADTHVSGKEWVDCLKKTPGSAEDFYRRSSQLAEWLVVADSNVFKLIPNSSHDPVGYVELDPDMLAKLALLKFTKKLYE